VSEVIGIRENYYSSNLYRKSQKTLYSEAKVVFSSKVLR